MSEKLFHLISFIGAIQGLLLAVIFISKASRHPATSAIAAYVFVFSFGLLEPYFEQNLWGWARIPVLYTLSISNLLYGPLVYLFVCFLTSTNQKYRGPRAVHFLPFALMWVTVFAFYSAGIDLLAIDLFQICAFELLVVQILSYNIMAIRRLQQHRHSIQKLYSFRASDLNWLRSLLLWITLIYVLSFVISHLLMFGVESARSFYLVVQVSITIIIYSMSYRLILQPGLFFFTVNPQDHRVKDKPASRYLRSGLKDEQANLYLKRLNYYMQEAKPYRDSDLSIQTLSENLKISKNHLTQVINEKLEKNFYAYINEYRIQEAKDMIIDPAYAHLSLAGIGFEAGFKSKTSFNINFKKVTGVTPTEWKRAACERQTQKHVSS